MTQVIPSKFNGSLLTAFTPLPGPEAWYLLQVIWQVAPPGGPQFNSSQIFRDAPQMSVAFNVPNDGQYGRPSGGGTSDWYTSRSVDLTVAGGLKGINSPSPPLWTRVEQNAAGTNASVITPFLGKPTGHQFRIQLTDAKLLFFPNSVSQSPLLSIPTHLTPNTACSLIWAAMFTVLTIPGVDTAPPTLNSFLTLPESIALCRICPNEEAIARQARQKFNIWLIVIGVISLVLLLLIISIFSVALHKARHTHGSMRMVSSTTGPLSSTRVSI